MIFFTDFIPPSSRKVEKYENNQIIILFLKFVFVIHLIFLPINQIVMFRTNYFF